MGNFLVEKFGRRAFLKATGGLILASALPAMAYSERPLKYEEVKRLIWAVSPFGKAILSRVSPEGSSFKTRQGVAKVSGMDPAVFLQGATTTSMLTAVDTMIHETTHHVCKLLAYDHDPNSIYERGSMMATPDTKSRLFVKGAETFPSVETVDFFSGRLQRAPRFDTYIDTEASMLGTQQNGIYGLLDEYNAYYSGTRAANDLFKYFLRLPVAKGSELLWLSRLSGMCSGLDSFPEFRGYIGGYLAFAKQSHPAVYKQVTGNAGFVKAFSALTAAFQKQTDEIVGKLDSRIDMLSSKGLKLKRSGDFLLVGSAGNGLGLETYRKVSKALSEDKRIQAELAKLKA